ncbi:MAG: hypothetical protein QOC61_2068, partial [Acidobacteriota bacterium]|nr:hypothetical protein [Acidobacteriota bacterium]
MSDGYLFYSVLNNPALLVSLELRPARVNVPGLGEYLIARQILNSQKVHLPLELWDLAFQLSGLLFERPVFPVEA